MSGFSTFIHHLARAAFVPKKLSNLGFHLPLPDCSLLGHHLLPVFLPNISTVSLLEFAFLYINLQYFTVLHIILLSFTSTNFYFFALISITYIASLVGRTPTKTSKSPAEQGKLPSYTPTYLAPFSGTLGQPGSLRLTHKQFTPSNHNPLNGYA